MYFFSSRECLEINIIDQRGEGVEKEKFIKIPLSKSKMANLFRTFNVLSVSYFIAIIIIIRELMRRLYSSGNLG